MLNRGLVELPYLGFKRGRTDDVGLGVVEGVVVSAALVVVEALNIG